MVLGESTEDTWLQDTIYWTIWRKKLQQVRVVCHQQVGTKERWMVQWCATINCASRKIFTKFASVKLRVSSPWISPNAIVSSTDSRVSMSTAHTHSPCPSLVSMANSLRNDLEKQFCNGYQNSYCKKISTNKLNLIGLHNKQK